MELYNYFRSSASYRVRIALALKGLPYDYTAVHLQKNEQTAAPYASVSAARLVPLLKDGDALVHQSMAIIEYLDETHPTPALLPKAPLERARVRAISLFLLFWPSLWLTLRLGLLPEDKQGLGKVAAKLRL